MKPITLLLFLLAFASLACGVAVPITPAPVPTATARPLPTYSEPLDYVNIDLGAEVCTLVAVTDTNVRSCASVSCEITGDLIQKGEIISAACNELWAYVPKRGWVCVPAMIKTGYCK